MLNVNIQKPVLPKILLAKTGVFLDLWLLKADLENEIHMRQVAKKDVQ